MLAPYRLYRYNCYRCGVFERGLAAHLPPNSRCPGCEATNTAELVVSVHGLTARKLPFHTEPHAADDPGTPWQQKTNAQASANGKSSGRPTRGNEKAHHGARRVALDEEPEDDDGEW